MKKQLVVLLAMFLFWSSLYAQEIRLAWDPNVETDLAGYRIYEARTDGGPYQLVGEIVCPASTVECATFLRQSLVYGTTYYYVATAFNTSQRESGYSNQVSHFLLNPLPPAPPEGLRVNEQGVNVQAFWSPVDGAQHYGVFFRPAGGDAFGLLEVVQANRWSGRLPPPGQRKGAELGVGTLSPGGWSHLTTYTFR